MKNHFGIHHLGRIAAGLLVLTGSASFSQGASSFTENFNSNTLPATLQQSGTAVSFNNGSVQFTGAADSQRTYLSTKATDFFSTSFVLEITFTTGSSIGFFGMGIGDNTGGSFEPGQPLVGLRLHPQAIQSGRTDYSDNTVNTVFANLPDGTDRLRLTWNASTQQATFQIDQGYTGGAFVADYTSAVINGADNGLTNSNTRLYFGGQGSMRFDDLTVVVPEPGSFVLVGFAGVLGVFTYARRKQRPAAI